MINIELNEVQSIELLLIDDDILIKNILVTLQHKREISTINIDIVILDPSDTSIKSPRHDKQVNHYSENKYAVKKML